MGGEGECLAAGVLAGEMLAAWPGSIKQDVGG